MGLKDFHECALINGESPAGAQAGLANGRLAWDGGGRLIADRELKDRQ